MTKLARIRIGTRKSALAMAQAKLVRDQLAAEWPHLGEEGCIEIVGMTTTGDTQATRPLADIGGKGLFTKELEEALQAGHIDMAVHSMKDMQTVLPDGLTVGCMPEREDPRDMLIGEGLRSLADLPSGATFGTSSLRRAAQVLMARPDIQIAPLRGNVHTRLAKVEKGEIRATMLAKAGLNRLDLHDVPGALLDVDEFIPAVAQGAIGIECASDNDAVLEALAPLADIDTESAVICERAFLRMLDGSCRTPIAAYADVTGASLHMIGLIARPDGSAHHKVSISGSSSDAHDIGEAAARELLGKAGKAFLS